jgi:hypothetical protein
MAEQEIKAIETRYGGYRYRSRLEARYAVFMDVLGIPFEYEKEGFNLGSAGCYLPDFFIPHSAPYGDTLIDLSMWLEIKGEMPEQDEIQKMIALSQMTGQTGFIMYGLPSQNHVIEVYRNGFDMGGSGAKSMGKIIPYTPMEDLIWFITNRSPIMGPMIPFIYRAVEAAKSARFEFGESGAL